MGKETIRVGATGHGASLQVISSRMRKLDERTVNELYRRKLEEAARPYPPRVRASALAIPVKPDGKQTGLRARIAACVTLSSGTDATSAYVSVWIDTRRMLPDYKTLPLYMEGVAEGRRRRYDRWRHPVYGHRARPWVSQASHPYFRAGVAGLDRAGAEAINRALDDVTREIRG